MKGKAWILQSPAILFNGVTRCRSTRSQMAMLGSTTPRAFSASSSPANDQGQSYITLSRRVTCKKEIKRSKFIGFAAPIVDEESAFSFLSEVRDPRATHNCWAYKLGDQYRSNDDGEPGGTAGRPIYSAIVSSGIDRVMVVVTRYFGGIELGTGGLVRAYGGVAADCLRDAPTSLVKAKVSVGLEVPFDLLGTVYHLLQKFQVEDIQQDYETGKEGITLVMFKLDYDRVEALDSKIKDSFSGQVGILLQ
ncbi:IMPACT family member in pol 5'region [Nymphaea thermarum]|uniref:uncharacterized protein LOC116262831 isoform X2 n=1 Tax=Nymphaea colorata TaxID=210225 RepID=UPI00129E6A4B|nr:uncharacterized protein LOC116262831 isoform X2 [Nymphaea colorata]KAF3786881.1 IMPACT family member in pol 5'region [Nymphaea thermarum]